jgi:hypothetical protein
VGQGTVGTPAEVRRSAYAQLMHHATEGKLTLDLEQTRLDDISQTWEHLKTGPARKLASTAKITLFRSARGWGCPTCRVITSCSPARRRAVTGNT